MSWRKSRRSMANGNCIEVAPGVLVRDTQDREGSVLCFSADTWTRFVSDLKR